MSFSGKVVLVTGASSGIGADTAVLFARHGANVAIVGRNEKKIKSVAEKIIQIGKPPLIIIADVSVDNEAKRIIKETITKFMKLDIFINNAGLGRYGTILEGNIVQAYDELINTNLRAVINMTVLAAPYLVATKGNVINISSVAALSIASDPKYLAYSISKAALDQFTKGAAKELAPSGVRVNSVNPGPVVTDFFKNSGCESTWDDMKNFTALKRVSTADEVADLIAFLAGNKAKGITGSIFVIDNGYLLNH